MLRDVFYYGKKPNVHPRERPAKNLEEARLLARTEHFWIVNEFCDYTGFDWDFDFDFLPDDTSWHGEHNNAWPSVYQKDSGTWLCPKEYSQHIVYRDDVKPLKRFPDMTNWVFLDKVDKEKFDFAWHPDPTEPPFTYKWGCKFFEQEVQHVLEYRTPGAFQEKWMDTCVELEPNTECIVEVQEVDKTKWDISWRPDPREPAYIYVWGNKYIDGTIKSTWEYHTPGATEKKYMSQLLEVVPEYDRWVEVEKVDRSSFDFSWRPDPREPAYIYVWGNKYYSGEYGATLEYHTPGATERKYMTNDVGVLPLMENYEIVHDVIDFDFKWRPNPKDPAYIYVFGNQYYPAEIDPTIEYHTPGATERKYVNDIVAKVKPDRSKFKILHPIVEESFDFSWKPNPKDPPYIYVFGNQWHDAIKMPTIEYHVKGATEYKYVTDIIATLAPSKSKWRNLDNIDDTDFDYSWVPDPKDPAYIYEFGTQWQKCGGPQYVVEGATEKKYVDLMKVKRLSNPKGFQIADGVMIKSFDFSWHPNETEEPYIYVFGNNLYPGEIMPTVRYIVPGATTVKFINDVIATLAPNIHNWIVPDNVDVGEFDFSWVPNPKDPAYIYEFGTQWQKNGGPKFVVSGATEYKYMEGKVIAKPTSTNWQIDPNVKIKDFDYSWHPNNTDEPFIYVFGNNQYPAQIHATIKYIVPGATQVKFVSDVIAVLDNNFDNWTIPSNIDKESFDFSWIPDPTSPPYIYEFATVWNDRGGPVYTVPSAIEKKYIEDLKAKTLPDKTNWKVIIPVEDTFDYSWVPHPEAPPYIYVFGNQWNSAERESTIEYIVPGASEKKYVNDIIAKIKQDSTKFKILHPILENQFDFSWRPDPYDDPFIYVFGNNRYPGEIMPTVEYHVENATERKYVDTLKAVLGKSTKNWHKILPVDDTLFDYSWVPNPKDPAYIYVFGNQWNDATIESTIEYRVPEATEYKYVTDIIAPILPDKSNYKVLIPIVENSFDFSWRPNPKAPPYIYVFGNQWFSAEKEATIEYHVEGATDRKYIHEFIAEVAEDFSNWEIPKGVNVDTFDFSWRPDPGSPPYIYQFGTLENDNDGPKYIHPNNTGEVVRLMRVERKDIIVNDNIPKYYIETDLDDLIDEHKNEIFWALNKNINYDNFDFNWRPSIEKARYIHVFGSPESELTQTYFVSGKMYQLGYRSFNFVEEDKKADSEYLATLFKPSDAFFIDRGNPESSERFEKLKSIFPNIIKTRYLNGWVDTIQRCVKRSSTQLAWILNSELDYTNFNFKYYPNPWQMKMVHVFGTQWSHWGTTYMVNRDSFAEDTKYIKIIEHLSNLNFVKTRTAVATNCLYDIYVIDHGNSQLDEVVEICKQKAGSKNVEVIKYEKSYLDTFKRILTMVTPAKENYIWITSSVCNYSGFNFSFICDPFAKDNLHVFPSNYQKFGDTFLVDVNKLQSLVDDMNLLEDYGKIQYAYQQRAERYTPPVFITEEDTHRNSTQFEFDFPYAIVKTMDNDHLDINYNKPISLWTDESKNIEILSTGGTALVIPKEVKNYVSSELYDYPYISKSETLLKSRPLDIVFLSNGENVADKHFDYLLKITKGLQNRVVRVDGVNGRAAAYHAAAEASNTPWFFAVFAKLEVNNRFNFNWQPDRLQVSKHYIFNALNPVNGLIYGHQAMIAYNKKLVLNNPGRGLDFTLDDEHEVVDLLSGIARFNTDKFSTWRTAFREVIKLKSDYKDVSYDRLQIWLNKAEGDYAEDCLLGAKDGVEYYNQVGGDIEKLKLSYEWEWLNSYYRGKYK